MVYNKSTDKKQRKGKNTERQDIKMTAKRILALAMALATAMSISSCGEVDESSSEKEKAAAMQSEESSEESDKSTAEESPKTEESSEEEQYNILSSAESLECFEQLCPMIYELEGQRAISLLGMSLGASHKPPEVSEDRMNAIGEYYNTYSYNVINGFNALGQRFYRIDLDCGIDDEIVNTAGFHMNTDINTLDGNNPTPFECKDAYESIYAMLKDRYGEPVRAFTPETDGYYGALWTDTPCGEIWLAWGEKIFGSEQSDTIISFSKNGINAVQD